MCKLFFVLFLSIIFGILFNQVFACVDILFVVDTRNEELSRDRSIQIAKTLPDDLKIRRWVVLSRNDRYVPRVVRNNFELITVLSSVVGEYDRFLEVASAEIARRTETYQPFVILLFSETPVNETMTQIWRMISKAPALHIYRIGSNKKREILSEHEKTDFEQLISCGRNKTFGSDTLRLSSKFNGNEIRRKPISHFTTTTTSSTQRPFTSTRDPQVRKLTFYDPNRTLLEDKQKSKDNKLTYIRTFKKYTSTRPSTSTVGTTRKNLYNKKNNRNSSTTKLTTKSRVVWKTTTRSIRKYTSTTTKPPKSKITNITKTVWPKTTTKSRTTPYSMSRSWKTTSSSTKRKPSTIANQTNWWSRSTSTRKPFISHSTARKRTTTISNRTNWWSRSTTTRKLSTTHTTTRKPTTTSRNRITTYAHPTSKPHTTTNKLIQITHRDNRKNDVSLISTTPFSKPSKKTPFTESLVTRRPSFSSLTSVTTAFPLLQTLAEPPKKEQKVPQEIRVRSRSVQFAITEKPLTTTSARPTRTTSTTQRTTTAPKVPYGCVVDVYFLVDLSQGTGDKSQQYLDIAASTINAMPISQHAVRVGLISFSGPGRTQVHVYLDKHNDKEGLIEEMFLMERHGGTTRTADAIRYAIKTFDDIGHPVRRHSKKVMVVFTDGFSHDEPKEAARIARGRGIQLIAVAVQDKLAPPNEQQLITIGGNSQNFLISPSGRLLREKILSNQCRI